MALPVVFHPAFVAPLPANHRFPMGKFGELYRHLIAEQVVRLEDVVEPRPAPRSWLELAHTPTYVTGILEQRLEPAAVRRIGLPLSPALAARSTAAVGGTVQTARLALEHGLACSTAGGSHHAFSTHGSGFCVFNDVAVAVRVLQAEGLIDRALVVDLDVHQGDGTAEIFAGDTGIYTFSMHCAVNFPVRKQQSDRDVGLPRGTGDAQYLATLERELTQVVDQARPDIVFYNAGVDPHEDDRIGRLALTDAGLAAREHLVLGHCRAAGIPVAGVIGGGYAEDLAALAARHAILHRTAAALLAAAADDAAGAG